MKLGHCWRERFVKSAVIKCLQQLLWKTKLELEKSVAGEILNYFSNTPNCNLGVRIDKEKWPFCSLLWAKQSHITFLSFCPINLENLKKKKKTWVNIFHVLGLFRHTHNRRRRGTSVKWICASGVWEWINECRSNPKIKHYPINLW